MKPLILAVFLAFLPAWIQDDDVTVIYLIGDSTMADYTLYEGDYMATRYPLTGWGQLFQAFMAADSLPHLKGLVFTDSVRVDDRARGGRSTRTFFQEGRWRAVTDRLQEGDLVLMQFGHNDAAENKPERYVNLEGYREFLRLYITQTLEKGAIPIVLTPVNRNYPWENGQLLNCHGEYPEAARQVAREFEVPLLDLGRISRRIFAEKGREYVTDYYFMNLPAGKYTAYPDGQQDNTHFQPEGARAVGQMVFDGLKEISQRYE